MLYLASSILAKVTKNDPLDADCAEFGNDLFESNFSIITLVYIGPPATEAESAVELAISKYNLIFKLSNNDLVNFLPLIAFQSGIVSVSITISKSWPSCNDIATPKSNASSTFKPNSALPCKKSITALASIDIPKLNPINSLKIVSKIEFVNPTEITQSSTLIAGKT